jgi:hypothetical protein
VRGYKNIKIKEARETIMEERTTAIPITYLLKIFLHEHHVGTATRTRYGEQKRKKK